jgi:hypothetical protein
MAESRLENDTDLLTPEEKTAIRAGLAEIGFLADRFFSDLPGLSRGSAASELNRLTAVIMRTRSKLLEFPDKPDPDLALSRFIDIVAVDTEPRPGGTEDEHPDPRHEPVRHPEPGAQAARQGRGRGRHPARG